MSLPSKAQLLGWRPDALRAVADGLQTAARELRERTDEMVRAVHRPADERTWTGDGQKAAAARAEADREAFDSIATRLDQAGEAVGGAFRAIDYPVARIRTLLDTTSPYIRVDNDWAVTVVLPDPPAELVAEAEALSASLVDLVRAAGDADARAARLVEPLLSGLTGIVPERLSISGYAGAADARALADGSINPEMRARIDAATELTASQWERLVRGERIDLPQGQFDYLVSFMDGLDGVPVDRLGGLSGDLRASLADGMQIVSNPNIGTFQQLPESAGLGTEAVGGLDRLPAQVRTLLTEDPTAFSIAMSEFSDRSRPDWLPDGAAAFGVEVPRIADYAALTDVVTAGDLQLRVGTDLDRSMIAQVAEMAAATQPDGTGSGWVGTWVDSDPPTDSTISSMLEVAASDRVAAHDALTGANMPDGYSSGEAVPALLTHWWGDQDAGVRALVDWIPEDAVASPGASAQDIIDAERAGHAADALAHTLADGRTGFQEIPGAAGASLGEVNGGLTQSLAGAMSPYLGTFVGAPDDFTNTRGAELFSDGVQMADMLEVLNSNHDAGMMINTRGIELYGDFAQQFGRDTSDTATEWGQYSGRMVLALADAAEAHDQGVRAENHGDAIGVYERKAFASGNLAALVSVFPTVGGPVAGLADSYYNYLNNPTPNPYEATGDSSQSTLLDRMLTDRRLYGNVAEGLTEAHADDEVAAIARNLADGSAPESRGYSGEIAALDRWSATNGVLFEAFRSHLENAGRYEWRRDQL